MGKKSILIILGILIIGFLLRIYRVTEMPMYGDELTLVYDSYSILKTGHDQTGKFLPITFSMRGRSPGGYVYASLPFVAIFGPTAMGVRSLSLLSSLGIIVLMYFLGKKLFNEKVGLIASFLAAISPWDIYLARGGFETHFALFLTLLGVVAFLNKKYIVTSIVWGLAFLTYPTFKLTLPILFLVICWYAGIKDLIKNKFFIISLVVLTIFGGITAVETFRGGEQRFLAINVFSQEQVIQKVTGDRNFSTLPLILKPIFYNRPLEYFHTVLDNYVDNFSIKFLYLRGDGNPRHNPGEWGMLYLVDLPLLFVGIFYLAKSRELKLLLAWILIAPLAPMLIGEAHGLRSDLILPPLILISAFAISKLSKPFAVASIGLMLVQLVFILNAVYFLAPAKFATFWSAEAKSASLWAIKNENKGKKVVLTTKIDNIEYAYPVYAKIDPNLVIMQYEKFPKIYGNVTISDK
jgi:4-amino-4-deoxy-L-arabinose transferase-like glycosyltransferase